MPAEKSLLLRNNDIRLKFWPEIPKDLSLWGNPASYILSRISDIPIFTPRIAPQMLKVLALDVKWPGIDRDALNAYQKLWRGHVFQGGFIIYELLKDFTNCRNMSHKAVIFGSTLFCPTTLRDHSFSTYAKFSVKLTFLTPWHAHVRKRQRARNITFFGKLCVGTKWMIPKHRNNWGDSSRIWETKFL